MTVRETFRRTKIVATIGPATSSPDMIRQLIEAGASTFRLNFSHGTHADHHRSICNIRQVSSELNQPVGILQDLQGPKIRLGVFKEGPITLNKGDKFTLTSRKVDGNYEISCITYDTLAEEVPIGAVIMLDDGKVEMVVEDVNVELGDLGVEIPAEDVPIAQKQLIKTANRLGIPVITATQMLDSMVSSPRATRAEISDVANAIIDGTDAVMLSNETAVGKYPILAVETMARIAVRIEREQDLKMQPLESMGRAVPNAISQAVGRIAIQLEAAAIVTLTKTGSTARNVSKFRPPIPILAVTPNVQVARRLQMVWGVQPMVLISLPSARQNFEAALNLAQEMKLLSAGDLVVMSAGTLQDVAGSTDLIKVEFVSSVVGKGLSIGSGIVNGRARVAFHHLDVRDFNEGEILVIDRTDADYIEVIRKASAVITEDSSLDSHAVVIGRRLGIPILIGVHNATGFIRDGEPLSVNFSKGMIYSGSRSDDLAF